MSPESITHQGLASLKPIEASGFTVPETDLESLDRQAAKARLAALPFVDYQRLERPSERRSPIVEIEDVAFPVSRIIATERGFGDWAGAGTDKNTYSGEKKASLDAALDYLELEFDPKKHTPLHLRLFTDDDGEIWGQVVDGTHRIMAAKLRGDEAVTVDLTVPEDPDELPRYRGSVLEDFSD
ncbi:hypothetical protein HY441_01470 [Candidatus Microgenomates bacterium]|nr:hypothetical protein [Candidatus Microgenomates bacterium]